MWHHTLLNFVVRYSSYLVFCTTFWVPIMGGLQKKIQCQNMSVQTDLSCFILGMQFAINITL